MENVNMGLTWPKGLTLYGRRMDWDEHLSLMWPKHTKYNDNKNHNQM
jgi:hypothetical protein